MWRGSASTWIDLGSLLPTGYSTSNAWGISEDESFTYITGWAMNTARAKNDAFMWIHCRADTDYSGSTEAADIIAFLTAWFANDRVADFDANGEVEVPDIFAFLTAWFAGCP